MPSEVADRHDLIPGRPARKIGATALLAMVAALASVGCAGTPMLVRPALDAEADAAPPTPKRDPDVVLAQAPAEAAPAPADPSPDTDPGDLPAPSLDPPAAADDGTPLFRYDPMRGAALSPEPPPNRDITLRELIGLGRSDIADMEVEVKPDYPDLHADPLARSKVPPAERDRPLFPALSNLIFEHDDELDEDAEDARDNVTRRRSKYDVTNPGPDTANFPTAPSRCPRAGSTSRTRPSPSSASRGASPPSTTGNS